MTDYMVICNYYKSPDIKAEHFITIRRPDADGPFRITYTSADKLDGLIVERVEYNWASCSSDGKYESPIQNSMAQHTLVRRADCYGSQGAYFVPEVWLVRGSIDKLQSIYKINALFKALTDLKERLNSAGCKDDIIPTIDSLFHSFDNCPNDKVDALVAAIHSLALGACLAYGSIDASYVLSSIKVGP
jgi:hypothetical protein